MPDSAKGSTSHPNFARFARKNPQETFEDLSDQKFKVWMSKATGVRCTYCDGQGPLVACTTATCTNHACVLKERKVKGCVGLEQFENKEFRCPRCLVNEGKDILYKHTIPEDRLQWNMDGRWPDCLVHGYYVPEGKANASLPAALTEVMATVRKSFQDEPTQNKLVVAVSPLSDRETIHEPAATKKLKKTVTQFLQRFDGQPQTWNYLAAIQTKVDPDCGHFFIGKSQKLMLPIDDFIARLMPRDLWSALLDNTGVKGLLLVCNGAPLINPEHRKQFIDLVQRRTFSFVIGLASETVDSTVLCKAFTPLVNDMFNRFSYQGKPIWNQLSEAFINTVLAHKTSVLFIYRLNTSDRIHVREMFDPLRGFWGCEKLVKCPARGCEGELIIKGRTRRLFLCFLCRLCKRQSAYIPMPGDMYPVGKSGLYSHEFPALISTENHIWGQWRAGDSQGRPMPAEHSDFPRKVDVTKLPVFSPIPKRRKKKTENQASHQKHAHGKKRKWRSAGEAKGQGDGGESGRKRARVGDRPREE